MIIIWIFSNALKVKNLTVIHATDIGKSPDCQELLRMENKNLVLVDRDEKVQLTIPVLLTVMAYTFLLLTKKQAVRPASFRGSLLKLGHRPVKL